MYGLKCFLAIVLKRVNMDIEEFRIKHSILIEHYQYIEHHLEGLYAINKGKDFYDTLVKIEKDPISKLLSRINKEAGGQILDDAECERLRILNAERNYWTHNCYVDLAFDAKTGGLKHESDEQRLRNAIAEAENVRNMLFDKKLKYYKGRV